MKLLFCDSNGTLYGYAAGDSTAGGNGKWQWLLARALVRAGWSIVVGVWDYSPEIQSGAKHILQTGQERHLDGVRFVGMQRGNFLLAWTKLLSAERPDWWYWQGAQASWGAMLFIAKTIGVRSIFSTAMDVDLQPRVALVRRRGWWPLYAWGLSAVDRIVVQHQGQLSHISSNLLPKAVVVPGLVSVPEKIRSRAERGNHVAWVSFLRQTKRPDLLIEMARKSPDVRYVVCGAVTNYLALPGYGERMLAEMRSLPNIEYLGHLDQARTLEVMAAASALICTSDVEGFPNTFLEAWSVGTPVVSLTIDPGNVIRERSLGFVSDTTDRAVSDIRSILSSPDVFETLCSSVRTYVREIHSDAAVARIFNEAILRSM